MQEKRIKTSTGDGDGVVVTHYHGSPADDAHVNGPGPPAQAELAGAPLVPAVPFASVVPPPACR